MTILFNVTLLVVLWSLAIVGGYYMWQLWRHR